MDSASVIRRLVFGALAVASVAAAAAFLFRHPSYPGPPKGDLVDVMQGVGPATCVSAWQHFVGTSSDLASTATDYLNSEGRQIEAEQCYPKVIGSEHLAEVSLGLGVVAVIGVLWPVRRFSSLVEYEKD